MAKCANFNIHEFRNVCKSCDQPRQEHPIHADFVPAIRSALNLDYDSSLRSHPDYSWVPKRCPQSHVQDFFKQLPTESVPRRGSNGERHREVQYVIQFPMQDIDPHMCRFLTDEDLDDFHDLVRDRELNALDEGFVKISQSGIPLECMACQQLVNPGELVVESPRAGPDSTWHPACFVCVDCKQMPVDLISCINNSETIFCFRHYGEYCNNRCYGCDELIFGGNQLKVSTHMWHPHHFCCRQCHTELLEKRYFEKDEQPYCLNCYEALFRSKCRKCSLPISVDHGELTFRGDHWHEHCMCCEKCNKQLTSESISIYNKQLLCHDCYCNYFAPKCRACSKALQQNVHFMELENGVWHRDCFTCGKCGKFLEDTHYIPRQERNYCISCYQEHFSIKCTSCQKPILSSGVTFRRQPYHISCVNCKNCSKALKGQAVFTKDKQLYCEVCYGDLYCDTCQKCHQTIIGDVRFTKHEGRSWHEECFLCSGCTKSLLSEEVSVQEDGVFCKDCALERKSNMPPTSS